jgi:hypothetical protein
MHVRVQLRGDSGAAWVAPREKVALRYPTDDGWHRIVSVAHPRLPNCWALACQFSILLMPGYILLISVFRVILQSNLGGMVERTSA